MMIKIFRHIHPALSVMLFFLASLLMQACSDHKEEPEEPTPAEAPKAPRTILVYMVANNSLGTGQFDKSDIKEMVQAAANGDFADGRLVLYHASSSGTVLKEVTSEGIDTLKVYDNSAYSVSIERMRQVITDTKELAPARDYGLVLWSHATGWLQDGIDEPVSKGYRSFGAEPGGKYMNITSLRTAIEDAEFSFVYFDCCYMGSVEVVYELRNCAPYMIVSPAEDPADGMPYDINLKNLFDTVTPLDEMMVRAARATFDYYNDVFVRGDCPCTMTVVRTSDIKALADVTQRVYAQASTSVNPTYKYQKFKVTGVCHYYDFEQYIESICPDEALFAQWQEALSKAVIYADATPYIWSSTPIVYCCGLSTYILSNELTASNNAYNTLTWYPDVASYLFKY